MLTYDEVRKVIAEIEGRDSLRLGSVAREQARPGDEVDAVVFRGTELAIQSFTWGFFGPDGKKLVFNTRIESALGGSRMWARALGEGRCILPAATFFEHRHEFAAPDGEPLLLASVCDQGRVSIVTTEPNAAVAPIHHRMPLVLRFEEVPLWLGEEFATLSDRSAIALTAKREANPPDPGQLSLF